MNDDFNARADEDDASATGNFDLAIKAMKATLAYRQQRTRWKAKHPAEWEVQQVAFATLFLGTMEDSGLSAEEQKDIVRRLLELVECGATRWGIIHDHCQATDKENERFTRLVGPDTTNETG